MLKKFKELTEKEILAIAIAAEEEDGRIYGSLRMRCERVSINGANVRRDACGRIVHRTGCLPCSATFR